MAEAKELNRYNRSRAITLKASISKDYSLGEAISFLEKVADEKFDKNVKIDFKGQGKNSKNHPSNFIFLFLVSFLVIYLVLSAQFRKFYLSFNNNYYSAIIIIWGNLWSLDIWKFFKYI